MNLKQALHKTLFNKEYYEALKRIVLTSACKTEDAIDLLDDLGTSNKAVSLIMEMSNKGYNKEWIFKAYYVCGNFQNFIESQKFR